MSVRKPLSKKLRFEVFKRDKFTCQYCGAKAPDVVLHCDHLHPVAKGGKNDVLNLVTACEGCNSGKGARLIDDSSVIERQRAQLETLESRREQLQMMLQWRDELEQVRIDTVEMVADRIAERGSFVPNENGKSSIRKWLKQYSFDEVLVAVDEAFDIYMRWNGDDADEDAWNVAFKKVPAICSVRKKSVDKPWLRKLFYIQGILRNRFRDREGNYVKALEEMVTEWGAPEDILEDAAKHCSDWSQFNKVVANACHLTERQDG